MVNIDGDNNAILLDETENKTYFDSIYINKITLPLQYYNKY